MEQGKGWQEREVRCFKERKVAGEPKIEQEVEKENKKIEQEVE